jgi:F-type H+-transporting ATPase subunit b
MLSAEFWLAVSFFIFITATYKPMKNKIISFLDKRSSDIKKQLEEADFLIAEANKNLEKMKEKYKNVEKEVLEITKNCEKEIALMTAEAKRNIDDYLLKKSQLTESKIENDKKALLNQLRTEALQISINASKAILEEHEFSKEKDIRNKALDKMLEI